MTRKTSNHEKAPICAAFVKEMREVFGQDVKVLWVKEGDFEIGARDADQIGAVAQATQSGDTKVSKTGEPTQGEREVA